MQADAPSAYELLQALLPPAPPPRRRTARPWSHPALGPWLSGLRSLSQVIFINDPRSGALLLLAFLISSPWLALLAAAGTAAANLSSRLLGLARNLRQQGIHGFNGALVGCGAAALEPPPDSAFHAGLRLILVLLGGGLSTWILERWRRRFPHRGDPAPLTLPFCLVTWGLLTIANLLAPAATQAATTTAPTGAPADLAALLQALALGLPHSFGQVFLCSGLASGLLVLLAVALASPLAAALGLGGALMAMLMALLQGADTTAVAQGLWGYNGVLVAIAIGGIFHVPCRRSLPLAAVGAALTSPLLALQQTLLPALPPLTLSFILVTWILQRAARRAVPALIPVSLHAVVTPEEHRQRFAVARDLLGDFRRNLRHRQQGREPAAIPEPLPAPLERQIHRLFSQLDRDRDGSLSLTELREALEGVSTAPAEPIAPQLAAALAAMDLDRDGRVDRSEFTQLIRRLQRLRQGEERLLLYLMPADADGNDRLDGEELERLLRSIGQPPLTIPEQQLVFGPEGSGLSWRGFVDRLLLG
jgi:urea transporter